MTDEILSQEEIDALLHGNKKEKEHLEEQGGTAHNKSIEPYDFTKGGVVVRKRIPALEMVHERFARLFRLALFGFLRRPAQVSVKRYEFLRFEDYVHNLPLPAAVNVIRIRPISGMSLFIMNARLVSQFVDIFFNGGGRFYPRVEGRDFSAVDQRIIQLVMEHVFTSLQEAWSPLLRTKIELVGFETNPFLPMWPHRQILSLRPFLRSNLTLAVVKCILSFHLWFLTRFSNFLKVVLGQKRHALMIIGIASCVKMLRKRQCMCVHPWGKHP